MLFISHIHYILPLGGKVTGIKTKSLCHVTVILFPLPPVFLMHKNPQRRKIICGMCPAGHKDRLIDLKMFFIEHPVW